MAQILDILLKISLVIFMVGNLLDMGLRLKLADAVGGLKNVRFVTASLLWGFVLCPGLACLLTLIIPLEKPYAMGMLLLGMAPCAPFLPTMVERARADLSYAAAFMLLASVVTVIYMPAAVPLMVKGLTADAWTIAKPLVIFLMAPLAVGFAIQRSRAALAARMLPVVKKLTGVDTLIMLVLCIVIYARGFLNATGSYAFGAQILFFAIASIGSYWLSPGLTHGQRSVVSLGMATRNIGAALAPLFALSGVDQRAIVMVVIGVPMQTIAGLAVSAWLARRTPPTTPTPESTTAGAEIAQP